MSKLKPNVLKLLVLLGLAVLVQAQLASSTIEGAGQGRDLSQCGQGCSAIEGACKAAAVADCNTIFTPGSPEADACISTAVETCGDAKKECKKKCNINRGDVSPTEP